MYTRLNEILEQQSANLKRLSKSDYTARVSDSIDLILSALKNGNKVLIAGNGGSAADAQHFAGEFVGRFLRERDGLPAVSLTTDSSVLTCVGNDYGYDEVFKRQINALGKDGDIFIGISTSGNSGNILAAIDEAHEKNMKVIGMLGKDGGKCKDKCDISLVVPFDETPRVQEVHTMTVHMICEMVEKKYFGEE